VTFGSGYTFLQVSYNANALQSAFRPSPVPPHPVFVYGVDDHDVDEHAHGDAPRRHEQRDPGVLAVVGYADAGGRTQHP